MNTSTSKIISAGLKLSHTFTPIWRRFNFSPTETKSSRLPCCAHGCTALRDLVAVRLREFLRSSLSHVLPQSARDPRQTLRASAICRDRFQESHPLRHSGGTCPRVCRPVQGKEKPSPRSECRKTHPS